MIGGSGERLREEESNIIRHDICQNVYTRADFDPVIFYPKACNLRQNSVKYKNSPPLLNNFPLYTPWVIPLHLLG